MPTKFNPKKLIIQIFLGCLVLTIIFGIFIFLLFIDEFRPRKQVFETTFTTSKQTKIKLSVEERGFIFENKDYNLNFAPANFTNDNCSNYVAISGYIGKQFTQQYTDKVDLNQMFEFKTDKVILFRDLHINSISPEKRKEKNYNYPHLIIPESFYMRDCR